MNERQPKLVCCLCCTHSVEMTHWVQNKSFKIAHKRKLALDSARDATFTVEGALASPAKNGFFCQNFRQRVLNLMHQFVHVFGS